MPCEKGRCTRSTAPSTSPFGATLRLASRLTFDTRPNPHCGWLTASPAGRRRAVERDLLPKVEERLQSTPPQPDPTGSKVPKPITTRAVR